MDTDIKVTERNDEPTNSKPIIESVAITGVTAISTQPATISNLAVSNMMASNDRSQQNTVAQQQRMNQLRLAVTGRVVGSIQATGPLEARSSVDVLTGNDLASAIASLSATLRAMSPRGRGSDGGSGGSNGGSGGSDDSNDDSTAPMFRDERGKREVIVHPPAVVLFPNEDNDDLEVEKRILLNDSPLPLLPR